QTHGYFIYQSTLWVPLILHWPSAGGYHERVEEPASLIGLAPTLLEFLGVAAPASFQGHSLMKPGRDPVYSESMYARDHVGCSPLRSIRSGNYKYIDAPKPELYDLAADPAESHNRFDADKPLATKMRARLAALAEAGQRPVPGTATPE